MCPSLLSIILSFRFDNAGNMEIQVLLFRIMGILEARRLKISDEEDYVAINPGDCT